MYCLTNEQVGLNFTVRPAQGPMSLHPTTLGFKAARRWMHQEQAVFSVRESFSGWRRRSRVELDHVEFQKDG
jgi:hypothetical protein